MKTSYKLRLPLLLPWTLPAVVQAQDFTCTTNNGTITLTGYTGPGDAADIAEQTAAKTALQKRNRRNCEPFDPRTGKMNEVQSG